MIEIEISSHLCLLISFLALPCLPRLNLPHLSTGLSSPRRMSKKGNWFSDNFHMTTGEEEEGQKGKRVISISDP